MKIQTSIYVFTLLMLFVGCNSRQKESKKQEVQTEEIYTCSMHPQIQEHLPGDCPICGMKLVKKHVNPVTTNNIQLESLLMPSNQFVVASVPLAVPQLKSMNTPARAYGIIEYDTRAAGTVSARVSGRIEKMYIRYRYQPIEKGQKIMDIYSPEILTAEQNLLFLLQHDANNISFIQAAKDKLLLLGMSQEQLQELIRSNKPLYSIGIYSSYAGHVHDAGMVHDATNSMSPAQQITQELSLKEGMYVQKGQNLLMIMNHHMVWAALQIFPGDQSFIKVGNAATIIPETDTSAVIKGNIDFIEPFFREGNKTITARVYFHNVSMLPIGSHVTANISTKEGPSLWLPQSAVLSLGINSVTFIKQSDGFLAHKITTGTRAANDIQILSGLSEKDTVAMNVQYFMDSESFIVTTSKQ